MKINFLLLLLFITFNSGISQSIKFADDIKLMDYPKERVSNWDDPFVPCDFNGDEYGDLLMGSKDSTFCFLGQADGSFQKYILGVFNSNIIKYADFNNDGENDILDHNRIRIRVGPQEYGSSPESYFFKSKIQDIMDFNNDGLEDIVTAKWGFFTETDSLFLQKNIDNYSFEQLIVDASGTIGNVEVMDIDSDGNKEIIYLYRNMEKYIIKLVQISESNINTKTIESELDLSNLIFKLADFDNDNDLDILATDNKDALYVIENIDFFENYNTIKIPLKNVPVLNVADLNQDGYMDIIAIQNTSTSNSIFIIPGKNNLNFGEPIFLDSFPGFKFFPNPFHPIENNIFPFDFDFDGNLDIVYTQGFCQQGQGNCEARLFRNESPSNIKEIDRPTSSIFPVPATDCIYLKDFNLFSGDEYKLFGLSGELIRAGKMSESCISIGDLKPGLYYINWGDRSEVKRFMKI